MRTLSLAVALVMAAWFSVAQAQPAPSSAFPAPHRPVADIVSPTWGDHAVRDRDREVPQIASRLHIRQGMTVADIGAGSGYDTLKLAKVVGAKGAIIAEDVTPAYLETLKASAKAQHLSNIQVVVGLPGDPKLPPRSINAAIMVHMYHEIQDPFALLSRLAPAFKPGGLLGVEELNIPTQNHGTPPKLLTCELQAAGYKLVRLSPLAGELGYFAVFEPPLNGLQPTKNQVALCKV